MQLVVGLLDNERIVGCADHRGAGLACEACQEAGDRNGVRYIQPRGWLISKEEHRTGGDGTGDCDTRALSVGEALDALRRTICQSDELECAMRFAGLTCDPPNRESELDILDCREVGYQPSVLGDVGDRVATDSGARRTAQWREILTNDLDPTAVGELESRQDVQERRLAGA